MNRTDWATPPYYELPDPGFVDVPQPGGKTTRMASVEYTMAEALLLEIRCRRKFLFAPADIDPQDANPVAVRRRLIDYAISLTPYAYSVYIMPSGWDAAKAGSDAADLLFSKLKNIQVNLNDPGSNNVFDAWIDGTGNLYGGWGPGMRPA